MTDETQIAVREDKQVATPGALLGAMLELAKDPNFDAVKFEALANLQLKMEDRQEARALAEAIQDIQANIPPVTKDGKIPKGGTFIPFTSYENMMGVLQPFLNEHKIAVTFSSQFEALKFTVTCTARKGNATISASAPLPIDEGPGRNTTQAHGSSLSYGRRYALDALFNIIRVGKDDDGSTAHDRVLTEEQVTELVELLKIGGGSEPSLLTKFYGDRVHSLDEAPAGDYGKLKNTIEQRNRAVAAAKAKEG